MAESDSPVAGDLVEHPALGLGKVVHEDAADVRVYFKDDMQDDPDRRIRTFRRPCVTLTKIDNQSDAVLDNLPPLKNGRLQRMPTTLTLGKAVEVFSLHFPLGLSDPRFLSQEVAYKRAAAARFKESHTRLIDMAGQQASPQEISDAINFVYGTESLTSSPENGRLNFMFSARGRVGVL